MAIGGRPALDAFLDLPLARFAVVVPFDRDVALVEDLAVRESMTDGGASMRQQRYASE